MRNIMKYTEKRHSRLAFAMTFAALLLTALPAHGQYMSFFGDSTWVYHVVAVQSPPAYATSFPLGVYSRTFTMTFDKSSHQNLQGEDYFSALAYSSCMPRCWSGLLREDTAHGRLYRSGRLVCDMSLAEGDTFSWVSFSGLKRLMLVDSVRYYSGRKTICLSLLNHPDDYFFGTVYADQHADYPFSIRFIEGIGPTYGTCTGEEYSYPNVPPGYGALAQPYLTLLLCLYKDDSLVYMADERLGCEQQHVGVSEHPSMSAMNLYPNPATQYVVMDMSTGEEMEGTVVITDMLGRHRIQQNAEGSRCRIPVAELPAGMYFLTYRDGKRTIVRKFIKE